MGSNQGTNLFNQLLIPVTLTLSLFLLHLKKPNKNVILFYFRLIFLSLILVLLSMISSYKLYLWFSNHVLKGFTLGQVKDLAACIWCLESLVSFIYIVRWQYNNRFDVFRDVLFDATGLKGMIDKKKSIIVVVFVTTVICLANAIDVLIALISNLFNLTEFKEKDLVYDGVMLGKSELNFIVAIGLFYNDLCWNLATEIFILLCVFVTNEVKYLNKRIQTEPKLDRFSLELYLKTHKKLVSVVNEFNDTFNGYYFFVLLLQMPLTILLIFNVVTRKLMPMEWILFGVWIGSGVVKLFVLSLLPSQLHEQITETASIVSEHIEEEDIATDEETHRLAQWFMTRIQTNRPGLNIGGFFVITKELMLAGVSMAFGYLTLICESIVPPEDNDSKTLFPNGTIS